MLVAARMLGNASAAAGSPAAAGAYQKRLMFACMAGEPWGLMGTRRLLLEADQGSEAMQGLQLGQVEQVWACSVHAAGACCSRCERAATCCRL